MNHPEIRKIIVYVDMDHVLCDYDAGYTLHQSRFPELQFPQSAPDFYTNLEPMPEAIDTFRWLTDHPLLDVYILTAPSEKNSHCYSGKRDWVEKYLGLDTVSRLIISPRKDLLKGEFLVDDQASGKGQERFEGTLLQFGSETCPDWPAIKRFFTEKKWLQ